VQNNDKTERDRMPTSVEIVDVAPPNTDDDSVSKTEAFAGVTELSKEELFRLFQFRNLAYVGTLSKDGSPHITPAWSEMVDDLILINTFENQRSLGT